MNDNIFEIPARILARKLGIDYTRIYQDIVAGIIPARRYGKFLMIPLLDERVQKLFRDKETYNKERRKYVKRVRRPIVFEGKIYETQAELAKAKNVATSTVRYWINKGWAKVAQISCEESTKDKDQ